MIVVGLAGHGDPALRWLTRLPTPGFLCEGALRAVTYESRGHRMQPSEVKLPSIGIG